MTLSKIKLNNSVVTKTNNYTYSAGALVLKKEYLTTLAPGANAFHLIMSNGDDVTMTVTVTGDTSISPSTASFSKASPADVSATVTAGTGVTLSGITLGGTTVATTAYSYSEGALTVRKEYLAAAANGELALMLTMSHSDTVTLTVTVAD